MAAPVGAPETTVAGADVPPAPSRGPWTVALVVGGVLAGAVLGIALLAALARPASASVVSPTGVSAPTVPLVGALAAGAPTTPASSGNGAAPNLPAPVLAPLQVPLAAPAPVTGSSAASGPASTAETRPAGASVAVPVVSGVVDTTVAPVITNVATLANTLPLGETPLGPVLQLGGQVLPPVGLTSTSGTQPSPEPTPPALAGERGPGAPGAVALAPTSPAFGSGGVLGSRWSPPVVGPGATLGTPAGRSGPGPSPRPAPPPLPAPLPATADAIGGSGASPPGMLALASPVIGAPTSTRIPVAPAALPQLLLDERDAPPG